MLVSQRQRSICMLMLRWIIDFGILIPSGVRLATGAAIYPVLRHGSAGRTQHNKRIISREYVNTALCTALPVARPAPASFYIIKYVN